MYFKNNNDLFQVKTCLKISGNFLVPEFASFHLVFNLFRAWFLLYLIQIYLLFVQNGKGHVLSSNFYVRVQFNKEPLTAK